MKQYFIDYAEFQMEKAENALKAARVNFQLDDYDTAANRAYYAVFHVMTAIMCFKETEFSKHSSLIVSFRKEFIKTKIFDGELSKVITKNQELREAADYKNVIISKKDAEDSVKRAEEFYKKVKPVYDGMLQDIQVE